MHYKHQIFVFCLLSINLGAQEILVWNSAADSPIRDCYVMIEDANQKNTHLLSDADGKVLISNMILPFKMFAQHLNFEPLDTLLNSIPEKILMREKSFTLDEMVVTGQYEAQAMSASTYQVSAIDREILSNNTHNFTFFSLEQGKVVDIEPAKDAWDIAFTTWTEVQNFGVEIPYLFSDYVIQNREGVQIAENVIPDGTSLIDEYDNFTKTDAIGLSFSSELNTIASSWRTVASPTPGTVTAVKSDRFYVVQDGSGTMFKLAFTKMLNGTGERGYPAIQFTELR